MSTLTTVISLAPMAFFPGEGSQSMQPISLTVFGGMSFGSLMTLFIMPTIYFIFNNRRLKKAEKKRRKQLIKEGKIDRNDEKMLKLEEKQRAKDEKKRAKLEAKAAKAAKNLEEFKNGLS
jgi:hypothetical protein